VEPDSSALNNILSTSLNPIHNEPRIGDVKHSLADISKEKLLGYHPEVSFEEGLRKTLEGFHQ